MVLAEQAVFTSAETARMSGYQLAGTSPGLGEEDARELAAWCPSHDSLWVEDRGPVSVNFHPLPSGSYCVSRTMAAGQEGSGRGGPRVYTHCLVVGAEALARFGNNPFALWRAATISGPIPVYAEVPERLERLELTARSAVVDQALLARLAVQPGPQWIGTMVEAALQSACLAVAGGPSAESLIAGLMSCLPPECRTEFSFTTGLKFSLRRPFRIMGFPGMAAELRPLVHRYNLSILDLSSAAPPAQRAPLAGWGQLIERVLAAGRTGFLATQLSKRRFGLAVTDLPGLALQILEDLDASALRGDPVEKEPQCEPLAAAAPPGGNVQRAHAAHSNPAPTEAATRPRPEAPSKNLDPQSPEVLDSLEHLDDAVFEAIGGKTAALDALKVLWPRLRDELGEDLLAESREQYLRYALSIWEDCMGSGGIRNPARAVQALDVLCVLFDRV